MGLIAQAAEDGFVSRNGDTLDIFLLIAVILFLIAGAIAFQVKTFYATLLAVGLAAASFALMFL